MENIVIAIIGMITGIIPSFFIYKIELKKLIKRKNIEIEGHVQEKEEHKIKADVLDKILDFSSFNSLKTSVDELFKTTRADRFLILIAINGKTDFNIVSVIFEQHKISKYQINAIARYRTLGIDTAYKKMLKEAEINNIIELETETMENSLLKDIYEIEGVKASHIRHLLRINVDANNDVLVYSSLATHDKRGFTHIGKRKADIIYNSSIKPVLEGVLNNEKIR